MPHQVFNLPPQQPLSAAGRVLPGSKLYFFVTQTSTPTPVYTTSALSVAHSQPLIADAGGRFATVYLDPTITYKATVTSSTDVLLYTVDPVNDQLLSQEVIGSYLYPQTDGEVSAGVIPTNYTFNPAGVVGLDVRRFGLIEGASANATTNATRLLNAIQSIREDATTILDTIGGSNITAYRSGTLTFPRGIWRIDPDAIEITSDIGLTFLGMGFRGANNAMNGSTTLLFPGTSTGFALRAYRNGARNFTLRNLSVCYEDDTFEGDIVDIEDCPNPTFEQVFLGTFGKSLSERYQTARSLIRLTAWEGVRLKNVVMDGADIGVWDDDTRGSYGQFGGWGFNASDTWFYDIATDMIYKSGARTAEAWAMRNCYLNPININPERAIHVSNIDGFRMDCCQLTPSTGSAPTIEWMTLDNINGSIESSTFGTNSKIGTVTDPNSNLTFSGNKFAGSDGLTLKAGSITSHNNEWSDGTVAYDCDADDTLELNLGVDKFKAAVGASYQVASSANIGGVIKYRAEHDASTNQFTNAANNVRIFNPDKKEVTVTAASATLDVLDTGRIYRAAGAAGQVFTLPAPHPGVEFGISKHSTQTLQITAGSAILYAGVGALKTSISATNASDVGGFLWIRSMENTGWQITQRSGSWTEA